MALTGDQREAFRGLMEFLDSDKRIALLTGSGGTGKGYLVQYLIGNRTDLKFFCSATTNKATFVQMEQAHEAGETQSGFGTLYSLLGLRLTPDGEVKTIRQTGSTRLSDFDVVIADEISMANQQLVEHLKEALEGNNTKVILVGDPSQLPPVKAASEISPAFQAAEVTFELREVVRHEGAILKLCNEIRNAIEQDAPLPEFVTDTDEDGAGVFVLNRETWKQWIIRGFTSPAYRENGNLFKIIAWRNKTVDKFNTYVRRALYGEEAQQRYLCGEPVLTAAPVLEYEELVAPTDATGRIEAVNTGVHDDPVVRFYGSFQVWKLLIDFDNGNTAKVQVLDEMDRIRFVETLEAIAAEAKTNRAMWGTYHNFKDAFADIRYSHALTSHRSQGSTFENVFVDVNDIMANPNRKEMLRSLYVACSRASKNLVLYI